MKKNGFTLIEILLSIMLIGILSAMSVPLYQSFQNASNLNIARDTVVQALRQAQTYAYSGKEDGAWGFHLGQFQFWPNVSSIEGVDIIIFKGTSYETRDTNFDEVINLPNNIMRSGVTITFAKLTGKATGTLRIILNSNKVCTPSSCTVTGTSTINIDQNGIIDY